MTMRSSGRRQKCTHGEREGPFRCDPSLVVLARSPGPQVYTRDLRNRTFPVAFRRALFPISPGEAARPPGEGAEAE